MIVEFFRVYQVHNGNLVPAIYCVKGSEDEVAPFPDAEDLESAKQLIEYVGQPQTEYTILPIYEKVEHARPTF